MDVRSVKMKIAMLSFYFGGLTNYFDLYLLSASYNTDIDFFFITDNKEMSEFPPNVHKIYMTFSEVKERIQNCVDIKITLEHPYKLTDYRVVFGLAFKDYIGEYDFWGQSDCDVIFGDIRKFITDDILNKYDKFYTRGFITLYRNNDKMRNLFLQKHNGAFYSYDEAFSTNYICHFDESAICDIADLMGIKTFNEITYADIDYNRNHFIMQYIQDEYTNQVWKWHEGKLFRLYVSNGKIESQEMLLMHLQKRKMELELANTKTLKSFLIVPNSFIEDRVLSPQDIIEYSRSKIYIEKYRIRIRGFIKKVKDGAIKQRIFRYKKKRRILKESKS